MATDGEDGVGRSKTLPSSDHPLSSASSAGSEAPSHGKPSDFSLDQPQRLADKLLQEDSMMTEVNSRAPEIGNQTEHSGNLGPSLLEEVLHSKKMALMRDPEVMEFLRQQQEAVAQEKAFERNMRMERKEDG